MSQCSPFLYLYLCFYIFKTKSRKINAFTYLLWLKLLVCVTANAEITRFHQILKLKESSKAAPTKAGHQGPRKWLPGAQVKNVASNQTPNLQPQQLKRKWWEPLPVQGKSPRLVKFPRSSSSSSVVLSPRRPPAALVCAAVLSFITYSAARGENVCWGTRF